LRASELIPMPLLVNARTLLAFDAGVLTRVKFTHLTKILSPRLQHYDILSYPITFKMTTSNNNNSLSAPLLVNEQHQDECECDQDDRDQGCLGCTLTIVYDDSEEEEEDENDEQSPSAWWFDNCVVWVVLPALLFLQFGMCFYMTSVEATAGLRWSVVNYSIVLFVITAILYRQSAKDCKLTNSAAILLPEILMDIILGLVLFDKVVAAFLFMLGSMLCLSLFVVLSSIRILIVTKDDECACECNNKNELELDVSLFQGGRVPERPTEVVSV
jgi:hypothetical protein